jgi:serine/threonine-protein kinase
MVMELLRGRNLRAVMRGSGRSFSVQDKLELMAQVCDALGHAHRAGIYHRDIKPSNIFIEDAFRAKVLDFGIARLASSNLTRPGRALGTPDYMAPEQILGGVCDARSDIFSTGIIAFEFLAGHHPFQAPSIPRRIVQGEPDRALDRAPHLPAAVEDVLSRALARHPAERYERAEQMAGALRAAGELSARSGAGL